MAATPVSTSPPSNDDGAPEYESFSLKVSHDVSAVNRRSSLTVLLLFAMMMSDMIDD